LSRAFCVHERFDLTHLPAARRHQALALKLESVAPFPDADHWVGWRGGVAHVWFWSRASLPDDIHSAHPLVPETVLHEPGEGIRLVKCLEGFEAQYWEDGQLRRSRWWPELPDAGAWNNFIRALGGFPLARPDQASEAVWLRSSWARRSGSAADGLMRREREIVIGMATVFALAYGWQMVALAKYAAEINQAEARIDALSREANEELEARNQALSRADDIAYFVNQQAVLSQQQMMATVLSVLPVDAQFYRWRFEHGRRDQPLRFEVDFEQSVDTVDIIRRLEGIDFIRGVSAERTRGDTRVEFRADLRLEAGS